jgi:hypothetical protein
LGARTTDVTDLPMQENLLASEEMAHFLRNGPARAMIDRLIRTVAELAEVEFVSLGLRNSDKYHFISTHGFPLTPHVDSVPAGSLKQSLFASAVEVANLQKETNFAALPSLPIAKTWRYGANVPIRLDRALSDSGVLALSVADRNARNQSGLTMVKLSRIADHIADVIWLAMQIYQANSQPEMSATAVRLLIDALHQTDAPMALVDSNLNIVDFSPGFSEFQNRTLGTKAASGDTLVKNWLDSKSEAAARLAFKSGKTITGLKTFPSAGLAPIDYDFHLLNFPAEKLQLGVFSIPMRILHSTRAGLNDVALDNAANTNSTDVVSDFLFETLLHKRRLLQRNGYGYLAVRGWRKPIKAYQLSGLKALKKAKPDGFAERIASELDDAIKSIHGSLKNAVVVPVPCGHSGEGCLTEQIAKALARRIGIPMVKAFAPLAVTGSSHPKTNAKRPKMTLLENVQGQIILVDDVATSGAHMEEARKLLSENASAVWSIAWIAD